MAVKIVTDSVSDITPEMAKSLGITVIPLYVRFGDKVYKDRIEMSSEDFYKKLVSESTGPSTTQPTPKDFTDLYNKLARETDEILVIVLSKKMSGTYDSALAGKKEADKKLKITVIDSEQVIMGSGLLAIAASKAAKKGATLDELTRLTQQAMERVHPVMYLDTLKFLAKGGRIGKAKGLVGGLLSFKPILTIKDGEVSPLTRVRARSAGIEYLYNYVAGFSKVQELAVEYATTPEDADALIERLSAICPKDRIYKSTIGPVVGTYTGPGVISVTVLEGEK